MKKSLIVLLSVLVVLIFSATSFALHQVPDMYEYTPSILKSKAQVGISGQIRVRGRMSDNTTDFRDTKNGATDDSFARYDQRARLGISATVSPSSMGMIELESGNSDTVDSYTWADSAFGEGTQGLYGDQTASNSKRGAMYIRQAYIAHQTKALGVLSGFKVGHMLMALGNGIFYDHTQFGDDAIILWIAPAEGMEVSLNTIKLAEGTSTIVSDDANAYIGTFSGAFGPANISADVTYVDDNSFATCGWTGDGLCDLQFWNIGARGDVNAGPAKIKADIELQTGIMNKFKTNGDDMDIRAWAAMIGADIMAGPVTIGVEGGYGTGDDIDTEDKFEGFITSLSQGERYTYLYDQFTRSAAQGPSQSPTASSTYAGGASNNDGISNVTYIRVDASAKPIPDLGLEAALIWLRASQEVAKKNTTTGTTDDQDMGVELDGKIYYDLGPNLVYYIEAGYLWAGDFFRNVTLDNKDPDDPWSVRHGVLLTF